jgi:hypothetical protein
VGDLGWHLSADPGVWIAAALTLFIFSFLYKDNPLYKFAEHLFVGVSAGYIVVQQFWQVLFPNLIEPMFFQPGTPDTWKFWTRGALRAPVHALLGEGVPPRASRSRSSSVSTPRRRPASPRPRSSPRQATMLPLWNSAHTPPRSTTSCWSSAWSARSCSSSLDRTRDPRGAAKPDLVPHGLLFGAPTASR